MTDPREIVNRLRNASPAELRERISIEAERLAEIGAGPTALVMALLELDSADLAPLAAERHFHATQERWTQTHELALGERSPILAVGDTLHTFPIGSLGEVGLGRFVDRVLAAVLWQPSSRVILHLAGLTRHPDVDSAIRALESELLEQKIDLILDHD